MRQSLLLSGAACCLALTLSGCATNTIRIDRARTMVTAGHEAGDATRAVLLRTRASNREVLIDLVASDPNCALPEPTIVLRARRPAGTRFCLPSGVDPAGYSTFDVKRITEADFAPTLAVLNALTLYLDRVDAVATREPLDIGGEIEAARADLDTILGTAAALGAGTPKLPQLSADQEAAVKGALSLLSTIVDEQQKVDALRRIESGSAGSAFGNTLQNLEAANGQWLDRLSGQLANRRTLIDERLDQLALAKAPDTLRRPVVAAQLDVIEQRESVTRLRGALAEVTDVLGKAHADYRDLLFNKKAKLTEAERRKRARINRERVMTAFKSLTAVILAF